MVELPTRPRVASAWRERLLALEARTRDDPPADLAQIVREELRVDMSTRYGCLEIPHPFGKASGQLSCTVHQVEADVRAGVAFVVLKTVIAEGPAGTRSMEAWTIPETRMRVERRTVSDGRVGWTVTWKGRGWTGSLDAYCDFFEAALGAARAADVPVIPSVKYHLPGAKERVRLDEYRHTTTRLLDVWDRAGCGGPMLLEKDLSPTLAGDPRASARERVVSWLGDIPGVVAGAAPGRIHLGIKLMNALFDDTFQVAMVRAAARATPPPAFLVVFNRLFDPDREVAYGGWELSDRNLRVLEQVRALGESLPPLSATGNICSGRVMTAYALLGCENGQLHTFFQLPLSAYTATGGSRTARALHTLMLHPTEGLAVWLRHLHEAGRLETRDGVIRFRDVSATGRDHA